MLHTILIVALAAACILLGLQSAATRRKLTFAEHRITLLGDRIERLEKRR